ncbi:aromatic ring-hydroxylating oxygenase subunit alpha [Polynucleobacter rarus]|uniref:aromatic ring-hydroxylating oxygenase subunit alpha n=1 Tax=Polynucleobacter rarus TaxID=556055 RepID=UPI000D3E6C0A|nr:aromatic ring-hydroxylating dioxygenase subunit alpha [Polynucleobacter rarus]
MTYPFDQLQNDWHPIAIESTLLINVLTPITLLGQSLVLWRDEQQQFHLWLDQCPHRGMKLSLGTIENNHLICPYHGWQFNTTGKCSFIPALPHLLDANLKAQVKKFQVQVKYGLVWACLGDPASDLFLFPEFDITKRRIVFCGPYDINTSGPRIIENFLDMAHFPFVHEGTLGDKNHMDILDYLVEEFSDDIYGHVVRATQCFSWQPQSSKKSDQAELIEYAYRVVHPFSAILNKKNNDSKSNPGGLDDAISLHLQPIEPTTTRAWIIMALRDFEHSDQELREFQDFIFLQDKSILENQIPKLLPLQPETEVSVVSDRLSIAYRKYLRTNNLQYGVMNSSII